MFASPLLMALAVSVLAALPARGSSVPTQDLRVWLKADQGVAGDTQAVAQWEDQSGNGVHAMQADPESRPALVASGFNGLQGLRFDGVGQFMTFRLPVSGLSALTIVLVSVPDPGQSAGAALSWKRLGEGGGIELAPLEHTVSLGFGTAQRHALPALAMRAARRLTITTAVKDASGESLFVDGSPAVVQRGRAAILANTGDLAYLGRGEGTFFRGLVLELLVYSRALSEQERNDLESYLTAKYSGDATPARPNTAPAVDGGPDRETVVSEPLLLNGRVFDDTTAASSLNVTWSKLSGAGEVAFQSATEAVTSASFSAPGTYVLRLSASDGEAMSSDEVTVAVGTDRRPDPVPAQNLHAWFRADEGITAEGGGVARWADQSGNGADALQGSDGNRPAFGSAAAAAIPAVEFDGADDFLEFAPLPPGSTGVTIVIAGAAPNRGQEGGEGPIAQLVDAGFGSQAGVPVAARNGAGPWITSYVRNAGFEAVFVNGEQAGAAEGSPVSLEAEQARAALGRIGLSEYAAANVHEVLIYSRALSGEERTQVEEYLAAKYLSRAAVRAKSGGARLATASGTVSAAAATALVTGYTPGTKITGGTGKWWTGMKFTTGTAPLSVTALGRMMLSGNAGTHTLKLVNAGTSADVPGGSASVAMAGGSVGQFRYATLPAPVTLAANTAYYLLSTEAAGADHFYDNNAVAITTSAATVNGAVVSTTGTSGWYLYSGAGRTYGPVGLLYADASATPAPACPPPATGAFTGCYYDNMDFTAFKMSRTDAVINFAWKNGSPDRAISADTFSATWEGNFSFNAGTYTFTATADDGIRVFVDGALVISGWKDQAPTTYTGSRTMTAGNHLVRVEYYENCGGASATVSWAAASAPASSPDTTAPSVPANLTATAVSSSQINLSWNASSDNVGVAGYKVFRNGAQIATVSGTSYQNTGLSSSTSYSYTVAAYDAAGNSSSQSAPASATTQTATAPPPPSSGGLDIRSYGARCDGVTNDGPAIQAALNAVPNGGSVDVPCLAGVSSPGIRLANKTGVTVRATVAGAGFKALSGMTLGIPAFGPFLFVVDTCNNCVVTGLEFRMNNVPAGGIGITRSSDAVVQNNKVLSAGFFTGGAISASVNTRNRYIGNLVDTTAGNGSDGSRGLWIGNWTLEDQEPLVENNIVRRATGTNIVSHPVGGTFRGNVGEDSPGGGGMKIVPKLGSSTPALIEGNQLRRNKFLGLQIDLGNNMIIRNNVLENNYGQGMALYSGMDGVLVRDLTIESNTILNNNRGKAGSWGMAGILVHDGGQNIIIRNNIIEDRMTDRAQQTAIWVYNSRGPAYNFQIYGNTCKSSVNHGIVVGAGSHPVDGVSVKSNTCSSNGGYGLYFHKGSATTYRNVTACGNTLTGNTGGTVYNNTGVGISNGLCGQ